MRLMAAKYGATMVYSEEIIDRKVITARREFNEEKGLVHYFAPKSDSPFFSTVPGERIAFQIGTSDSTLALQAASVIARDVRAIDINMGCPKHFSVHAGMGAALLSSPETVKDILSTLKRNLNLPITCKIRLLPSLSETVEFLRIVEACGVDAIAVHARLTQDRPIFQAMVEGVEQLVSHAKIPVIHNADIFYHEDIRIMKERTKADSVMIARGAQWNPSIFSKDGMLPVYQMMKEYLDISIDVGNHFTNTKYGLIHMVRGPALKSEGFVQLQRSKSYTHLTKALELLSNEELLLSDYDAHVFLTPRSEIPEHLRPTCQTSWNEL